MKKILLALLVAGLLLTGTACGKNSEPETTETPETGEPETMDEEEETPEIPEANETEESVTGAIAEKLEGIVSLKDGMTELSTEANLENAFPGITAVAEEITAKVNATGAYAEEIVVVKAKEGSFEEVQTILNDRVDYQKEVFEDYRPDEMVKLASPVLISSEADGIVVLVIADNADAEKSAIESVIK